jgi:hypothetical protein
MMVHLLLHHHGGQSLAAVQEGEGGGNGLGLGTWSAMIGVPLHLAFTIEEGSDVELVPETYQGGIWVFVASSQPWSMKHEGKLFDLVRFVWLLFTSRYSYNAAQHLSGITLLHSVDYLSHEIKQVANALSPKWLVRPDRAVEKVIEALPNRPSWAEFDWRVVPFPELLVNAGRMIRLWCQLDRPGDFFGNFGQHFPQTIRELVLVCWQSVKGSIKPLLGRVYDLSTAPEEIEVLSMLLDKVDKLWADDSELFCVQVTEELGPPTWDDPQRYAPWMKFFRLFATCFANCVRYAHPRKPITIIITRSSNHLAIRIENFLDDPGNNGLDDQIAAARGAVSSTPWNMDTVDKITQGALVFQGLVRDLGGWTNRPDPRVDPFVREVHIPYERLYGRRG